MTILHLTTFLQGGAGRAITDLACAQHLAGHEVVVVTSERGEGSYGNYPECLDRLRDAGVRLLLVDSLFTRDLALTMHVVETLRRTIDVETLDVVHAHAARPALIGRLFLEHASGDRPARVPIPRVPNAESRAPSPEPRVHVALIQTQHGWGTSKTPEQAAADVQTLREVDRVIATSGATRDLLASFGVPVDSISVIPCGLAREAAAAPPAAAHQMIHPLRTANARVVGCIGSVTTNKNQTLLIDALPALADLDVVTIFIGEGSEALAPYAEESGVGNRVIACGYQPAAASWLPLMDLLVIPSRTEGQGLAVLEAFRAGVPVVASDIPALAELVDDGRTGFLFAGDDSVTLAAAIRRALTLGKGERATLVAAARDRFVAGFTIERMVAAHEALYAGLTRE